MRTRNKKFNKFFKKNGYQNKLAKQKKNKNYWEQKFKINKPQNYV